MQSGYYALGIHPDFQQFLCFEVSGRFYVYTALPFGLNLSPLIYTKFMRCVVAFIRHPIFADGSPFSFKTLPHKVVRRGMRSLIYLDDLLVLYKRNGFLSRRIQLL